MINSIILVGARRHQYLSETRNINNAVPPTRGKKPSMKVPGQKRKFPVINPWRQGARRHLGAKPIGSTIGCFRNRVS
ncbi:MAG TPA: hypothetical protein IGS52_15900 [Oscillatoriaceae cyanobacterium M33_DOE_052]|nr:hypothetical protein [Oscillatoriaceae cyanobacterium M33_DOE_052]